MSVENKVKSMAGFQQKLQIWHKLVLVLACVVVIVTTYALVVPAITMEGDFICGKPAHVHTDACYSMEDGRRVQICGLEEHTHDERCLVHNETAEEEYACGYDYEHVHGPECYQDGKLLCTLAVHTHTRSCEKAAPVRAMSSGEGVENPEPLSEEVTSPPAGAETPSEEGTEDADEPSDPTDPTDPAEPTDPADPTDPTEGDPTEEVSEEPGEELSKDSSEEVTEDPSEEPSEEPSEDPSEENPSEEPSEDSSEENPSEEPSGEVTEEVTQEPADGVTEDPSEEVSEEPSEEPSEELSEEPSEELTGEEVTEEVTGDEMLADAVTIAGVTAENGLKEVTTTGTNSSVKFEVLKTVGGVSYPVNPEIATGEEYSFALEFHGINLRKFSVSNTLYYYDMVMPVSHLRPVFADAYLQGWAPISSNNSIDMFVVPMVVDGQSVYRLYLKSNTTGSDITINGIVANDEYEKPVRMDVTKGHSFNADALAYSYTIDAFLHAAIDVYNTQYILSDTAHVSNHYYSGLENNDFTIRYRFKGDSEYRTLKELSDASPSDNVAYAMDSDGNIYFYNYIENNDYGYITVEYDEPVHRDKWYTNWAQTRDMEVQVVYTDTYGRDNFYDGTIVYNDAKMSSKTDGNNNLPVNYMVQDGLGLVKKIASSDSNLCTITLNTDHLDLGSGDVEINDTMTNAELAKDEYGYLQPVEVTRISSSGAEVKLTARDFSLVEKTGAEKGFLLTIHNPGAYAYRIEYYVQQPEDSTVDEYTNRAQIGTAYKSIVEDSFKHQGINYDDKGYHFIFQFPKLYELSSGSETYSNPAQGAEFTVYEVGADGESLTPVARSYTGGAVNGVDTKRYVEYIPDDYSMVQGEYQYEGEQDMIVFDNYPAGLERGKLYVVKETSVPFGYVPSNQEIYFYFNLSNDTDTEELQLARSKGAYIVDPSEWSLQEEYENDRLVLVYFKDKMLTDPVVNTLPGYDLPETGGVGLLPCMLLGLCLTAAPVYLCEGRKRRP